MGGVAAEQGLGFGDVEAEITLETPGVEADGDVVGVEIGGGEIEIDQAGDFAVQEEYVVREQVGVDMAGGQVLRPVGQDMVEGLFELGGQAGQDGVGTVQAFL